MSLDHAGDLQSSGRNNTEAKTHFGALLDTAQREPVTVSKQGRPVAVMMSIHDYEEMKLARLRAHLAEGEAQIERGESTTIRNKQESCHHPSMGS